MVEWQSESSLLTLRVRGKQWYWVYKFDNKLYNSAFSSNNIINVIGNGVKNNNLVSSKLDLSFLKSQSKIDDLTNFNLNFKNTELKPTSRPNINNFLRLFSFAGSRERVNSVLGSYNVFKKQKNYLFINNLYEVYGYLPTNSDHCLLF